MEKNHTNVMKSSDSRITFLKFEQEVKLWFKQAHLKYALAPNKSLER